MDVGIFKASKVRLVAWIIIPPMLIVAVGLSAYLYAQRAQWQLKETTALAEILDDITRSSKSVDQLFDDLGIASDERIRSGDQLALLLREKARHRSVEVKRTHVLERAAKGNPRLPTVSALVEGEADFRAIELFLNDVIKSYPLISIRTIELAQPREGAKEDNIQMKMVFDVILVENMLKVNGDVR